MIHPLFRLLVSEPQLLAEHVEAYSELVSAEVGAVTTQLKRRAIMHGLSVGLLVVGIFFLGGALMLWAAIPTDQMNQPWVLWAVPAIPIVMAVWSHFAAKAPVAEHGTRTIREQLAADAAMLRSVSAS
jgi:hypothetical protein